MRQLNKALNQNSIYVVLTFLVTWLYLTQVKLKHEEIFLALLQTLGILISIRLINKVYWKRFWRLLVSFMGGWVVSFVISVVLEAYFSTVFFASLIEHLEAGMLAEQMFGWFIVSISYGGAFQALVLYFLIGRK